MNKKFIMVIKRKDISLDMKYKTFLYRPNIWCLSLGFMIDNISYIMFETYCRMRLSGKATYFDLFNMYTKNHIVEKSPYLLEYARDFEEFIYEASQNADKFYNQFRGFFDMHVYKKSGKILIKFCRNIIKNISRYLMEIGNGLFFGGRYVISEVFEYCRMIC